MGVRRFKLAIRLEGVASPHDLGEISIKKGPATDCGIGGEDEQEECGGCGSQPPSQEVSEPAISLYCILIVHLTVFPKGQCCLKGRKHDCIYCMYQHDLAQSQAHAKPSPTVPK